MSLPANTPAYQPIKATIVIPESGASYSEYQTERPVIIRDALASSAPSVDYLIRIVVDREKVAAVSKAPASLLIATNPAKPKAFEPSVGVSKGRFITIEAIPLSNVGASAVSHTLTLSVDLL